MEAVAIAVWDRSKEAWVRKSARSPTRFDGTLTGEGHLDRRP